MTAFKPRLDMLTEPQRKLWPEPPSFFGLTTLRPLNSARISEDNGLRIASSRRRLCQ